MIKEVINHMWRRIFGPEEKTEIEAHRLEVAEERLVLVRQRVRALQELIERRVID